MLGRTSHPVEVDPLTTVSAVQTRSPRYFLPADEPVRFLAEDGTVAEANADYPRPDDARLVEMHRQMVIGRRLDEQATALTKQGRLAVYPSARGQEACQIAAAMCLTARDWLFPTYRDSVALLARGIEPSEILTMLAGDWHCGYDPIRHRCAPHSTPLATQLVHAVGLADGERRRDRDTVVVALCGDGATSEGDFHEALNFAAVFAAPVVFLVQNNGFAISVPLARQTVAPSLAHKGIGYGIRSQQVDGNDPVAMLAVLDDAVAHARDGHGPVLVEAHTYRIDAHTNADDATRYRDNAEVEAWRARDPIMRLESFLRESALIDEAHLIDIAQQADRAAAALREAMNAQRPVDPMELFAHTYSEPTPDLLRQRCELVEELDDTIGGQE
ncbi:pyruvate dehydrogenase (acetyl-transferring) E1 component subunit alpha [Nocardia cyriacigeorgica]|uniref:Pyruvate dehydrogenase (Acetyl-transferring) E1 component subunit alpha n=1 Tax=Nocardia cyriacigeorgica TaxID=135487 RepID=A0A6P1CNQ3_9NOCA|nr:pyruvate dehydrogenase (acetyl-transferring) E1 component subunit alpha [Nocardia cyriacigeorgica]NEW34118.1 pyruvate dehydrogenase (acetyl-transferring) E1 component subunit alpha [Nocardia cyriacigeorgica]